MVLGYPMAAYLPVISYSVPTVGGITSVFSVPTATHQITLKE